jgi:hypothetical protein
MHVLGVCDKDTQSSVLFFRLDILTTYPDLYRIYGYICLPTLAPRTCGMYLPIVNVSIDCLCASDDKENSRSAKKRRIMQAD